MAKPLAMMPWFPGDFLKSTRGWSITATGVYRALLDAQWDLGILPESPSNLRKTIGATIREWNEGWKFCETKFPLIGGGRQNERLEAHRSKSLSLKAKNSKGAKTTNIKRWGNGVAERSDTESLSDQTPSRTLIAERVAERSQSSPSPSEEKIKTPAALASEPVSKPDPEDPDDYLIWTSGVQLLGEGKRGLIGMLVKEHGRELVARKLGELMAMTEKPRDPAGYFVGAMRKLKRGVVV